MENVFLDISYLESRDELKDYILDTGDKLKIEFIDSPELSGVFTIDQQGEIYMMNNLLQNQYNYSSELLN